MQNDPTVTPIDELVDDHETLEQMLEDARENEARLYGLLDRVEKLADEIREARAATG